MSDFSYKQIFEVIVYYIVERELDCYPVQRIKLFGDGAIGYANVDEAKDVLAKMHALEKSYWIVDKATVDRACDVYVKGMVD